MRSPRHSKAARMLALCLCAQLGPLACLPTALLAPLPGAPQYQSPGLVAVPGGFVNAAGGNLLLRREDLSIDTPLGRYPVSAVYDSALGGWRWNHEIRYDGTTFRDATGASHDVGNVADGAPLPGTRWQRVDADTLATKGGLAHHFAADGSLDHVRFATLDYPRIEFSAGEVRQCTSAAACSAILTIEPHWSGHPAVITDARTGRVARFEYDTSGRLIAAKSPHDETTGAAGTRYSYAGGSTLLVALETTEGERVEYGYRPGWRVGTVRQLGEGDPTHVFHYYGKTLYDRYPTIHTNPLGGATRYAFDAERRLRRIDRFEAGETTRFEWSGRRPARVVDPAGVVSEFEYVDDRLVLWRRASGDEVGISYAPGAVNLDDPASPPVAQVTDGIGTLVANEYDALGRRVRRENGAQEATTWSHAAAAIVSATSLGVTLDFPVFGLHGHWLDAEIGGVAVSKRAFDAVGNATVPAAGSGEGGVLSLGYGVDRRVASVQVAASDDTGHVTGTEEVTIARRGDGQVHTIARPGGGDHVVEFDALGRAERIRERVDGVWRETSIAYDAAGNQIARERPNGMREEFDYDAYGRMLAHRALRDGLLEAEEAFTWSAGRLVARHDSVRGATEVYAYDAAGRVSSIAYGLGETIANTHDVRGRLVRETFSVPGVGVVADLGYVYDGADRLIRLVDHQAGEVLAEDHYAAGLPSLSETANGLRRSYAYDTTSNLVGMATVDAAGNPLETTTITRSALLGPPRLEIATATTTPLASSEEHYWLPAGMSLANPDTLVGKRLFGWHDGAGRSVAHAWDALGNPAATSAGDAFVYNAEGNRLLSADLALSGESLAYGWDEAGFATSRGSAAIGWSAAGRLASFAGDTFLWDLAGRLVEATVAGETREFRRFGGRVEGGPTTLGALDLGAVSIHLVSGERVFRHLDFRGNVSFVSDDAGAIVAQHRFHAFGLDQRFGTDAGPAFEHQPDLGGLVFLGERVLDSSVGRFLAPDPLLQWSNGYAYALGNPLWYHDRGGRRMQARQALELGLQMVVVAGAIVTGSGVVAAAFAIDTTLSSLRDGAVGPQPAPPPPPSPEPGPDGGDGGGGGGSGPATTKQLTFEVAVCTPLDVAGHGRTPQVGWLGIALTNAVLAGLWWRRRRRAKACRSAG